jgi:hypothetical protein
LEIIGPFSWHGLYQEIANVKNSLKPLNKLHSPADKSLSEKSQHQAFLCLAWRPLQRQKKLTTSFSAP